MERSLAMAMGPIEIAEDDCGTKDGIEITVQSENHFKSIVGKYFKFKQEEDWQLVVLDLKDKLINQKIILRSPMKCHTKDFRICRKCFGEKYIRTKYVGIVAAQDLSERLTQLSMRSFHTSGSASLESKPIVVDYIKKHLIDIQENDSNIKIIFNDKNLPEDFKTIEGYSEQKDNYIIYNKLNYDVYNQDVVHVINDITEMLKKQNSVSNTPSQYYENFIKAVLNVGVLYSSYVEMVLSHLFITDNEEFWRYHYNDHIKYKLSDKNVAKKLSKLLYFLYQPNKQSLEFDLSTFLDLNDDNKLSYHEKLFLGRLPVKRID